MALEARARLRCAAGSAEGDAVSARKLGRRLEMGCFLARHLLVEGLVGSSQADGIVFEEHQALQIDFSYANLRGHLHEGRQLGDRFLQARQPGRHPWPILPFTFLQIAKGTYVPEYAAKVILAANGHKGLRVRCIERDAKLVEARLDQRAAVPLVEERAIGIEEDVGAAVLEIAHHPWQVSH